MGFACIEGMSELAVANRATIANMSPEYGATMGFFPVDHVTLEYLKLTGRTDEKVTSIFQPTVAYAFSKKHLDGSHMLWSGHSFFGPIDYLHSNVFTNRLRWWRHIFELTTCLLTTTRLESSNYLRYQKKNMSNIQLQFQTQTERVYSSYLELDLADVEPCVSGPKR